MTVSAQPHSKLDQRVQTAYWNFGTSDESKAIPTTKVAITNRESQESRMVRAKLSNAIETIETVLKLCLLCFCSALLDTVTELEATLSSIFGVEINSALLTGICEYELQLSVIAARYRKGVENDRAKAPEADRR